MPWPGPQESFSGWLVLIHRFHGLWASMNECHRITPGPSLPPPMIRTHSRAAAVASAFSHAALSAERGPMLVLNAKKQSTKLFVKAALLGSLIALKYTAL